MTLLNIGFNLTNPEGDREFQKRAATHVGMAHFAGSGPAGATCRHCVHWQHADWHSNSGKHGGAPKDSACAEHRRLSANPGAKVPHSAMACKYFGEREQPVPLRRPEAN